MIVWIFSIERLCCGIRLNPRRRDDVHVAARQGRGFSHAKATPPVSKSIVDEFNLAIRSSSFQRPRRKWFPANIAISDILLKTRFFGLDCCRKKYPSQLSRRKNNYTIALEIGVFCRGASLWTPISGRWGRRPQSIYMDRWIGEWCSYNFAAGSFHTKKLCSRLFFERSWILLAQSAISPFCATLWFIFIYGSLESAWSTSCKC